jgi:release factor glutamine methyltransferase
MPLRVPVGPPQHAAVLLGYGAAVTVTASTPQRIRFGTLDIAYDDRVLRPRAWTAGPAAGGQELLGTPPPAPRHEKWTGAGQIGLLAVVRSERRLVAVDLDPVACASARVNAAAAGLADRVEVRQGAAEEAVAPDERFVLVVADPPWVPSAGTSRHPEDPLHAIDGGPDGLDIARRCVEVADHHLVPGGSLILQLGTWEQVRDLSAELRGSRLAVREVRRPHPTGVLVRLERLAEK